VQSLSAPAIGLPSALSPRLALAAYLGLNIAAFVLFEPFKLLRGDWELWAALPSALATGTLYSLDAPMPYVWSPLLAPVMALVSITGFWPQAVAHVAVLFTLRDRWLVALVASSAFFWPAIMGGNPMFTLMLVLAILSYRGGRVASLAFLALVIMIPRPLFLPLAAWLLWKRAELRVPFALLFIIHASAVAASGYAIPWIEAALSHSDAPLLDLGITAWVGTGWLVIGIPLGIWLTVRGHPGWAGLAVSPYILQGYLLMPMIEVRRRVPQSLGNPP